MAKPKPILKSHFPAPVRDLMERIRDLTGHKHVTISIGSRPNAQTIDVNEDGSVGNDPRHEQYLMELMGVGLMITGSLVVRQFLTIKTERVMPNGKKMWIPEKNVYGAFLGEGVVRLAPPEMMKRCHNTDNSTGESLPTEPSVHFISWPAHPQDKIRPPLILGQDTPEPATPKPTRRR